MIEALVCACLDVGSIRAGNIGWAVLRDGRCEQGGDLVRFVDVLVAVLDDARPLALGFECPLFIPARDEVADLLRPRAGEGNRSWSAGAGATVLAAGLAEAYWTLCRLHERCPGVRGTTRWNEFVAGSAQLLVFEAFVSSGAKAGARQPEDRDAASPHERDAAAAARAFLARARGEAAGTSDITAGRVLSLAGLQLLASGLSDDVALLHESCIVVKAAKP